MLIRDRIFARLEELDMTQKEFAEKTGYNGPQPSTQFNKAIAQKLNEVIRTQQKALVELSKTAI